MYGIWHVQLHSVSNHFAAKPPLPKYWLSCIIAQYHRKEQPPIQALTGSVSFQECTLAYLLPYAPKNWDNYFQSHYYILKITDFCVYDCVEPKRKKLSSIGKKKINIQTKHKDLLKGNLSFLIASKP